MFLIDDILMALAASAIAAPEVAAGAGTAGAGILGAEALAPMAAAEFAPMLLPTMGAAEFAPMAMPTVLGGAEGAMGGMLAGQTAGDILAGIAPQGPMGNILPQLPAAGAPYATAGSGAASAFGAPALGAGPGGSAPSMWEQLLGYGKAGVNRMMSPQGMMAMALMSGDGGAQQRPQAIARPQIESAPVQIAPRFNTGGSVGGDAYAEAMRRYLQRRKFGVGG